MAERRRVATFLFCDLTGSTALAERLDAEAVRELMFRYFHVVRSAIERHGGTIEKFVGDAVHAVFGVPTAHEDDPLRAVRAAEELRDAIERLNPELEERYGSRIAVRVGVNTGEAVAGDATSREVFVSGDAVNVAARLEQAAAPGDVLLGATTFELVRDAVEATSALPVLAKGKSEPLDAWRLVRVLSAGPVRRRRAQVPLVGRRAELDLLADAFAETIAGGTCRVATVAGEPGVGKSRLAAELLDAVGGRAQVAAGRCLAYGEGITWWPIGEIARYLLGILDEDTAASALERIRAGVDGESDAAVVADRVAQALGLAGGGAGSNEIPWAFRRLLGRLAQRRPLALLVDDIQWADAPLLDLLAGLAAHLPDSPLFVLCLTRPELLERRVDWDITLELAPLDGTDARELVRRRGVAEELHDKLLHTAGGNPLFLEELAAAAAEGAVDTSVPTTLAALLDERLDRLEPELRATLERASIEGEVFHRGSVVALGGEAAHLETLADRGFLRPARAVYVDEAAFRFRHILVRDAAYGATTKRLRATLHEQFADWLEATAASHVTAHEEILGYHLEQAYRYSTELAVADGKAIQLAERAGAYLGAAGMRASRRADTVAASALLSRAVELVRDDRERGLLLSELNGSLIFAGDYRRGDAFGRELEGVARSTGDRELHWRAYFAGRTLGQLTGAAGGPPEEVRTTMEAALPELERLGIDDLIARAWSAIAHTREDALPELERALQHAEQSGHERLVNIILGRLGVEMNFGPLAVPRVIRRLETLLARAEAHPGRQAPIFVQLGVAHHQLGDLDVARELATRGRSLREEFGQWANLAAAANPTLAMIEADRGDRPAAIALMREAIEILSAAGDRWALPSVAADLVDYLLAEDRFDEAVDACRIAEQAAEEGGTDDEGRAVAAARSLVAAARRDWATAEREASEALARTEGSRFVVIRAWAREELAKVLHAAGRSDEAVALVREAVEIYERKGATAYAARARAIVGA